MKTTNEISKELKSIASFEAVAYSLALFILSMGMLTGLSAMFY